jgi:hypothetical protein
VATDATGFYETTDLASLPEETFDPEFDEALVGILLEDYTRDPARSRIFYGKKNIAWMASDLFVPGPGEDCVRDFDLRSIPTSYRDQIGNVPKEYWADWIEIYQRLRNAWILAGALEPSLDYGLPLSVYAGCDCEGGVYYAGSLSRGGQVINRPFIAIDISASLFDDPGRPDNREYHEMGHAFMADAFGDALPDSAGDVNHGGYRNPSSTDSWTEGFAEFFSMMVTKHVNGRADPHWYRIAGEYYVNLEFDYRAWVAGGKHEELAVAGVLLDFEDGSGDYARPPADPSLKISWWILTEDGQGNRLIVGRVRNDSAAPALAPILTAVLDGPAPTVVSGPAVPPEIPPGGDSLFVLPLPRMVEEAEVTVVVGASPNAGGNDDDPIQVDLGDLWDVIWGYVSEKNKSNGFVFDVQDLYAALSGAYGQSDENRNGISDVDEIFIAHGLFADLDGDQVWDGPEEAPGLTSHPDPAAPGQVLSRTRLEILPAQNAKVDVGGVEATIVVTVASEDGSFESYGYAVELGPEGLVPLSLPPPEIGGVATLTVVANGYLPAVVGAVDATTLDEALAASPDQPAVSMTISLRTGTIEEPTSASGSASTGDTPTPAPESGLPLWPLLILGGGGVLFVLRRR